jgi:hypothetical protein
MCVRAFPFGSIFIFFLVRFVFSFAETADRKGCLRVTDGHFLDFKITLTWMCEGL